MAGGDLAAARVVASGLHAGPFLGVAANGTVLRVQPALFVRVAGASRCYGRATVRRQAHQAVSLTPSGLR